MYIMQCISANVALCQSVASHAPHSPAKLSCSLFVCSEKGELSEMNT